MARVTEHVGWTPPQETDPKLEASQAGLTRPRALEAGLALVVVGIPLTFFPFTWAPFADPKLLLAAVGSILIWSSGLHADRRLSVAGGAWVGVLGVATLAGVDRWNSVFGPPDALTGLLLLGLCGFLLAAGPCIPDRFARRLPAWVVGTALAVSVVVISFRFAPGLWGRVVPHVDLSGATVGSVVFASGLLGTAVAVAASMTRWSQRRTVLTFVILGSALSVLAERGGWIGAALGLIVVLWRGQVPRRRGALIVLTLLAVVGAWTLFASLLPGQNPVSVVQRSQIAGASDLTWRVGVLEAIARSWTHRPLLGWGPGNTWSAFLASAPPSLLAVAARTWKDAHDLLGESLATSGIVGLGVLLALIGMVARRAARAPSGVAWALGGCVSLFAFHMLQPLNVTLTPLLFLFAGIAAGTAQVGPSPGAAGGEKGPGRTRDVQARGRKPARRWIMGTALATAVALCLTVVVASTLERYGRMYGSEWALASAARVEPGRLSATEALSLSLALDGRSGDGRAAARARSTIAAAVGAHPWDPGVRLVAIGVAQLLNDQRAARLWMQQQRARFPGDVATLGVTTKGRRPVLPGSSDGSPAP